MDGRPPWLVSDRLLRLLYVDGPPSGGLTGGPPGGPVRLHHPVFVRLVRLDGPPWSAWSAWMVRLAGPPGPRGWSAWMVRPGPPGPLGWSAWMVRSGPPGPLGWSACRVRLVGPPGQPRRGVGTVGVHWRALMPEAGSRLLAAQTKRERKRPAFSGPSGLLILGFL